MSDEKIETLASKFKKFFLMEEKQEVKLETATLEDGTTTIEAEAFEVGNAVMIVTGDEKIPAPAGEVTLEDGSTLVINEEGLIAEVKPAAEVVEEEELSISELGNAILKINERLQAIENKETLSKEELESANEANRALVDEAKSEIKTLKEKITQLSAQPAAKPNSPAPQASQKESTMVMLNAANDLRGNIDNYYSKLQNAN